MTGMARILKTIGRWIPAISLLLCVGLSLLWMRSQSVSDSLIFPLRQADGTEYERVATSRGGIIEWGTLPHYQTSDFGSHTTMFGPKRRWGWSRSPWSSAFNLYLGPKFHCYSNTLSVLVFDRDFNSSTRIVKAYFLRLPHWTLLALAAFPAGLQSLKLMGFWRRRRRRSRGLCVQCGYDLRGGQAVCPECGLPADSLNLTFGQFVRNRMHTRLWRACFLVSLILVSMLFLHAWNADRETRKFQQIAETMERYKPGDHDDIFHSLARAPTLADCAYQIEFPEPIGISFNEEMTVRVVRDGKTMYSWDSNKDCGYLISGDQLVYSGYPRGDCGCTLSGIDLKTGQCVWRNNLQAVGQCSHSGYSNHVVMGFADGHIFVHGCEGYGDYIEVVNFATGKTVAHRVFPSLERASMPFQSTAKNGFAVLSGPDGLAWQDNSFSVIVARVASITKLVADAGPHTSHTVVLEPLTTVAGAFDSSGKRRIAVRMWIDPAMSSTKTLPSVGSTILAVLGYAALNPNQTDYGFCVGPDKYAFMPHSSALVEITGADDKVVQETLAKVRRSRMPDDSAAEPAEN